MRTETIIKEYYTFEELNDEQKQKAIDKNRHFNTEHVEWYDYTIDDAKEIGKLMGFDIDNIFFRGFSSQGDGACFECSFSHVKNIVKNVKEYEPQDNDLHIIAEQVQELYRKTFYTLNGSTRQHGYYYHEYSMIIDSGYDKGAIDYDDWKDLIADFARWIYRRLENEYDHLTSDDMIAESLVANETEFTLDVLN